MQKTAKILDSKMWNWVVFITPHSNYLNWKKLRIHSIDFILFGCQACYFLSLPLPKNEAKTETWTKNFEQ